MTNGIGQVNRLVPGLQPGIETKISGEVKSSEGKFTEIFGEMIQSVNTIQHEADHAQELLATGEAADLHQVMIAVEEAGITMDLFLEIRNRLLEGYQTLVKMPM